MAEKQESPFTNTRLMIAGVVLGIVGAILIFIYARMKINEATGGTVTVYFMAQDLAKEEELQERHVEARQMPGMFVQGDFTLATVKGGVNKLSKITGIKPIRDLKAGEPVVLLNFPYSADLAMAPQPPAGQVRVPIPVDPNLGGSEMLRVGTIANIRGNFNFSNSRTPDKAEEHEFCVLKAVQVVLINGSARPEPKDLRQVRSIAINVSEETSGFLKKLEPRLVGHYSIEVLRDDVRAADAKEQMPPEVRAFIIEKLGPPGIGK